VKSLTATSGGVEVQNLYKILAVRKNESLPSIKKVLTEGDMWEKQAAAKFIQYSEWPEVVDELILIAKNDDEYWLPRQSALYALGGIRQGNIGPEILPILSDTNTPQSVQLVTISTLARVKYVQSVPIIKKFTTHNDIRVRLFAYRALAELGESIDTELLLSSLDDSDYTVRQDACGALSAIKGDDLTQILETVADYDANESVRSIAKIGLIDRKTNGLDQLEKLNLLKKELEVAPRRVKAWIIKKVLKECGLAGKNYISQTAKKKDETGECSRVFLAAFSDFSTDMLLKDFDEAKEISFVPRHASSPTHQTLMDYAASNSISLPVSLDFTYTQKERMRDGSIDEDNSGRYYDHAYNPLTGSSWDIWGEIPTRHEALSRWNSMVSAFNSGNLYEGDGIGAWHYLGRVSHLLQDMSSPLHVFAIQHGLINCKFELFWENESLDSYLYDIGGALHSADVLPSEALDKLDYFTRQRLEYCYVNKCPEKYDDDVRGWIDVLAWITYFRTTFWGEIEFGNGASSGPATSIYTTETAFTDGYVGRQVNTLHTMFDGNIRFVDGWTDNYYEITDRKGNVFRWMSWSDIDDWSSCGRNWAEGKKDSSKRVVGSDDDSLRARITGRFWFDTRELSRRCYPHRYPNGDIMYDDLHLYFGKYGFPLTVRYNAGLLGLANRRITVKTNSGYSNFTLGRKDNFGNSPYFNCGVDGKDFYYAAKDSVTIRASLSNSEGLSFSSWLKNGRNYSASNSLTINTDYNCISSNGDEYVAQYSLPKVTVVLHPGDHGSILEANYGSDYLGFLEYGSDAPQVNIAPEIGYEFTGFLPMLPATITENFEATAQYKLKTCVVTFLSGDQGAITGGQAVQQIESGGSAVAPTVTPDIGWEFVGWDTDFSHVTSDLTVTALYEVISGPPDWEVPFGLQYSMTICARVMNNGIQIGLADGSMLSAWDKDGNIAGVSQVIEGPAEKLFILVVYSNMPFVSGMKLKIYDAQTGDIYEIIENFDFQDGTQLGVLTSPYIYNVNAVLNISMVSGWNWISFNVLPDDASLASVFSEFNNIADQDIILAANGLNATYYQGVWYGTLQALEPGLMYKFRTANSGILSVVGNYVDPATEINLVKGWNWLGYTLEQSFAFPDALSDFAADNNDYITNQFGENSTYWGGQWYGTLSQMQPGIGYMLRVSNPKSFSYSGLELQDIPILDAKDISAAKNTPETFGFKDQMNAYIKLTNNNLLNSGSIVSAWDQENSLLGTSTMVDCPEGKNFALTIFNGENSDGENITLRLFDPKTKMIYDIDEKIRYESNAFAGSIIDAVPVRVPDTARLSSIVYDAGIEGTIEGSSTLFIADGSSPDVKPYDGNKFIGWNYQFVAPDMINAQACYVHADRTKVDMNKDGTIDYLDMMVLLGDWLDQDDTADLTNDGNVNLTDYLILTEFLIKLE
jgi:hypothetical protein